MSESEYEDYKLTDEEEPEYIEASEYLPVKSEILSSKQEIPFQQENIYQEEKSYQEEKPKNTSFQAFVYRKTERKGLKKWIVRLIKLTLFLMCLPFIAMIAGFAAFVVAGIAAGGIGLLGGGVGVLVGTAFYSSYLSVSLIMFGISAAITLLASGALVMLLFVAGMKKIISWLKYYYQKRKQDKEAAKEVSEA